MQKIILTLTAVASIFIMSCNSNSSQKNFVSEKETFTPKEAAEILKGNALLIDVREPDELVEQSYDVKNSINIPLDSIESKTNSIPKDKQVILACQKGGRSQQAYDLLKKKGFTNIANLEGGMNAWDEAGLPTETGVTEKKACCANPNSKDCNPDGTCKSTASEKEKKDCKYDANGKCIGDSKSCSKTETKISSTSTSIKNHLEVYAFHGTRQCTTCKNMKANTKAALDKYFSEELKNGKIVFQIIDVDDAANEKLAEKYQATGTALMINNVVNGKDSIIDWSDFAFEKANDETAFIPELKKKIEGIIK
ncbi:MAG: nitrophenyl compound nitroreductase subunit ArsF family protein [Bacteroidia bacterium]